MASTAGQISGDVIDAIRPDLEAFASLWSALRTNYQGTNITKTVARLLHMYQPEDGVLAYERLLRTLYVLLEDFDGDGLRLLVSMVPPPKGVADEIIKEVFHKATGFVRLNAPIFHRNNSTNPENDVISSSGGKNNDGSIDSRTIANASIPRLQTVLSNAENLPQGTTILRAIVKSDAPQKSSKSPKIRPRDSEVFRGFPSNEITNTQSHARNMTHFYGPNSNYPGCPQRYIDYRDSQTQNSSSIPSRGIDPSAYRFKWIDTSMLVRKNNYDGTANYPDLILKTSGNKFIRLPITKINGPPIGNYNSAYNTPIQSAYQAYYQNSELHLRSNDCNFDSTKSDLSQKNSSNFYQKKKFEEDEKSEEIDRAKIGGLVNPKIGLVDHDYGCLRSEDYSVDKENYEIGNLSSPNDETIEKFRDTVKNSQRAIQEDIYRMDVVRCDEDVLQTTADDDNYLNVESLNVTEKLKKAADDFLKRAEEEKILESSPFPRTRILQDPDNYPPLQLKSSPRLWKMEKLKKYREKSEDIKDSISNYSGENFAHDSSETSFFSTKNSTAINQNSSRGNRGKIGKNQSLPKSDKTPQKMTNFCRNSSSKNYHQNPLIPTINDDNLGQISASHMESLINRNETMHQANSMADFVNYRKQYYDALLSIQRAKVAVANSLAISSSQTSTNCDPRVFQYLQQQHQLLQQQQQRILMTSQHPVNRQAFVQPNFSNMRGAAALWIRGSNDWKYSPCGQYAFPRQTFSMSTSSSSSSCPPQVPINSTNDCSTSENCPRPTHHLHRSSKPSVKRRKLEDIVGKLKDSDDQN